MCVTNLTTVTQLSSDSSTEGWTLKATPKTCLEDSRKTPDPYTQTHARKLHQRPAWRIPGKPLTLTHKHTLENYTRDLLGGFQENPDPYTQTHARKLHQRPAWRIPGKPLTLTHKHTLENYTRDLLGGFQENP
ncbi:hypothetical protein RRG08_016945 [Elysia crispata]|uniref:Uncharacterized protein n=1 Tax=Elysia crispata TaxID=231223 RepID=A0AAE1A5S8_9GAST|nr:hypothetical protein RRG08_016945 [Elysia crispata]